jgi:hypothetical protein
MKSRPSLRVERLEDRCVPATFGVAWPDGMHLTLSFAPDGTPIAGDPSSLDSLLAPLGDSAARLEILRAFQTWAVNGNLNIGVVADGGQDFAVGGAIQGDPRFGDVRIGARPLGSEVLAVTAPFNLFGTSSGNSSLNSTQPLSLGGSPGTYDLYTIYLQEAGHVFGLDNSPDLNSVMYEYYQSPRTGLSVGDVAGLQALYGARAPDAFEGVTGNNTPATATSYQGPLEADVGSLQDADLYRFTVPFLSTGTTIHVNTAGLSLLTAKVEILNSAGTVVATATATDPLNNDVTLNANSLAWGGNYYVRVSSGRDDVFGVGSYRLDIVRHTLTGDFLGAAGGVVNHTLASAAALHQTTTPTGSGYSYTTQDSFSSSSDVNYYKITVPTGATNLAAVAWGLTDSPLSPHIDVLDAAGNAVAAQVLTNDGGSFVVQVTGVQGGADYYLRVSSATHSVGDYGAAVEFPTSAVTFPRGVTGTLDDSHTQTAADLTVPQTQQLHLVLAADSGQVTGAAVRLTVRDSQGNVVYQLQAADGDTVSGDVMVSAGVYTVAITVVPPADGSLPVIGFTLNLIGITDPIGVQAADTTSDPSGGNSSGSGASPPPTDGGPTWTTSSSDGTYWF